MYRKIYSHANSIRVMMMMMMSLNNRAGAKRLSEAKAWHLLPAIFLQDVCRSCALWSLSLSLQFHAVKK